VAVHQLGHMQVCTSLQTGNHASTLPLCFFTGRMPFLPPNQQHQSTEGQKKQTAVLKCFKEHRGKSDDRKRLQAVIRRGIRSFGPL